MNYKAPNGRIIPRTSGGRFRRTTLADVGISQDEINKDDMVCSNCGHGSGPETWRPILKTGKCPKCQSQGKVIKSQ